MTGRESSTEKRVVVRGCCSGKGERSIAPQGARARTQSHEAGGLTAKPYGPPADYKAWRWAECQKIAAPRRRNKKEMLSAYQKFKDSWKRSSEQRTKSHDEKRSHMHAHLEAVCGHRHAVWDYLQTGELPPLRPAVAPLPLDERDLVIKHVTKPPCRHVNGSATARETHSAWSLRTSYRRQSSRNFVR